MEGHAMEKRYQKSFFAGWGDMDFNAHMRNTAYLDKSGDTRMMFFSEHGFPMSEFVRMRIGPVIMKDEIDYFREVSLLNEIEVTLSIAGLSKDGSRWLMRNDFFRPDGKLSARVSSAGAWLDLSSRKLAAPPGRLFEALKMLPKTSDFHEIEGRER